MQVKARLRHLRISPRKVRLVVDLIRGLDVKTAEEQLRFCGKRAAKPVLKLLQSAVANAKHNFNLTRDNLYVSKITADQGPSLKRWRARAQGRAAAILKRTSHISLILDEKTPSKLMRKEVAPETQVLETEVARSPVLPQRAKISPEKELAPKKKQHAWTAEQLRKQKRTFYIGDKFKGAAKKAKRMFRRKSI